jgi:beta-lactamase class A
MSFTRRQCLALAAGSAFAAPNDSLSEQWQRIASETDGVVGVAAAQVDSGAIVSLRGGERFPLASVCKLPIAIHILAMVDEGKLSLSDEIEIPRQDVFPGVSVVAELWPKQTRFRLDQLLEWMVAKSDNTAVETFFRIGGGAPAMAARFREWGINGIRIDRSERRCALEAAGVNQIPPVSEWGPDTYEKLTANIPPADRLAALRRFIADPRDTATPAATVKLLRKAFRGELLSKPSTTRLIEILEATTTGPARIKGLLPEGTVVAHKTGATGTVMGFNGATNDVGVILLPNAGQLAIAVYIKGSAGDSAAREKLIARMAKAAFDAMRA